MKINHNIMALKSNNRLQVTNDNMAKSIERLSSGYRINRAADDAAGMAISQKMKTQIRGLEQASRNASDGISVIQTAEGALNEVESMLQRMRELSVQAANGTNTAEDRSAIQDEIDQLSQEIDRISQDTEFNTKKLLNGDADRKTFSSSTKVDIVSLSDAVESKNYKVTVTKVGTKAKQAAATAFDDTSLPISKTTAGKVTINGETVEITEGMSDEQIYTALRKLGDTTNVDVYATVAQDGKLEDTTTFKAGTFLNFQAKEAGSSKYVQVECDNAALADLLGIPTTSVKSTGEDAEVTLFKNENVTAATPAEDKAKVFTATATAIADGNKVTISDKDGFEMILSIDEEALQGATKAEIELSVLDAGPLVLQIGANEEQTVSVSIPEVSCATLEITNLNVNTQDGAGLAISALDKAINKVSSVRAKLGAYENRLEHAITNLDTSDENLTEALSRIEDLDMAEEMSNYTQLNVLSQAGTSMLAQANQMPQNVLSLLQG